MTKVDIGIATYGAAASEWWSRVMAELLREQKAGIEIGRIHAISSALPDHNKNYVVDDRRGIAPEGEKARNERTDANKSTIVGASANGRVRSGGFLHGDADWIFFMDDDTAPPQGALGQLLSLGRDIVGGLYFLAKPPHNPIAYMQGADGLYSALWKYPHGALMEVDSIGMGCTLVHRSVYERIMREFELFQRPNGTLMPVLRSQVHGRGPGKGETEVVEGVLRMPLRPVSHEDERAWPFYAMEYGRTEDHHFCELARAIGIRPWLDTSIVCDHFKLKAVNRVAHQMMVEQLQVDFGDEQTNELAG